MMVLWASSHSNTPGACCATFQAVRTSTKWRGMARWGRMYRQGRRFSVNIHPQGTHRSQRQPPWGTAGSSGVRQNVW